jgi:GLPGLI family protein
MKSLACLLVLLPLAAVAQQGTVVYDETIRIEIELPPEMEQMRDRIPRERTVGRHLLFDGAVSLMRNAPQQEEATQLEAESEGRRMAFRMAQASDDEVYTDRDAGTVVEKRGFLERTFLIRDVPLDLAWRLTGERAEFLGYAAQKAVATTESGTSVEAWFTPEIPAPVGPGRYGGLPGLILVLTEDDGRRSFVAKEVTLAPPDAGALAAPTRGREVTREGFEALVEERMREMRQQGGIRIMRQN